MTMVKRDVAQSIGHSARMAVYEIADDELAVGSTLGAPKVAIVIKSTGAIQKVWSTEMGAQLIGAVVLRHYDELTGVYLSARQPGSFVIHPERQEHFYRLLNGVHVREEIFVLNGPPGEDGRPAEPPAVYYVVEIENDGPGPVQMSTYAFANLRGDTPHDVCARYVPGQNAMFAWNESQPERVRAIACTEKPASYETTLDAGKAVTADWPGPLANETELTGDPMGAMQVSYTLEEGQSKRFGFLITFSDEGLDGADRALRACPPPEEALDRTQRHFRTILSKAILLTPDEYINRGVLWAKANMQRVQMLTPTGWAFTNNPTHSTNSVGRDTAWFAYGGDYVCPEFCREALLAYVRNQQKSGLMVEYYDTITGETEDYGLNINDNTPLLILALWHHHLITGDEDFLREVYPAAEKAARHILSQRNEQGLVWCTADGTGEHGIAGWRNIIQGYQLSGAVTEINAECYAALSTVAQMARVLDKHEESAHFQCEADNLKGAINEYLYNPSNGLYYLNIDQDGQPHSGVTGDLVFPVMFGVAPEDVAAHVIGRLSSADFWTPAGIRTVPRDALDYTPDGSYGLMGGVWVGVSFWYAFAAAPYTPEFMARALSMTFRNYSADPRRNNTVPGEFSEWLHGETLVNEGMTLSPWFPPRYLWAAIEGVAGVHASGGTLKLQPALAPDWKWLAVQNLPFRGEMVTYFVARTPDQHLYTSMPLQQAEQASAYSEDITSSLVAEGPEISAVGLRESDDMIILVGSTDDQAVTTSIRIALDLQGAYRLRLFDSLLGRWADRGRIPAERLRRGVTLNLERRGFNLLDLKQEI